MSEKVVQIRDYERRSRLPPREPATIIILPPNPQAAFFCAVNRASAAGVRLREETA